ncbi:DUF4124 domain-containing protein [Dechloromonas sp. CZR5]|uniref:DUF4124 domain-containing protein n=1 Tax=Dechloromonas sp. CZR5 TaxID=2608630 RepID=UPI00123D3FCF|nr:DUF4124 domain-containing protein [Dechloromonas sp. CZR5]
MYRIALPLLAGLLLTQPAGAEIYKCRLPNGKTEISNSPCPGGSGTLAVRPDEAVSETSRQQAERDVERMRNYVEKRESTQRADIAAERQLQSQKQAATANPPRSYGDPDACLRDVAQRALEATQRAQLEAECRNLIRPPEPAQTVHVPVYVAPPVYPHHPHYPHPQPQPRPPKPEPPATTPPGGQGMVICAPGKPCMR